jgi:DNA topoisomerase-1
MSDARFETSVATLDCVGATFRANGIRTLFDGFTIVYTEGRDDAQEKETTLPELDKGEACKAEKIDSEQRFTQPPPHYTEATLVRALEEKGIGRPSTYSPTISTIVDRGYISREKKQLIPTELGFVVNRFMTDNFDEIVDEKFTAMMESQLDDVETDKVGWVDVLTKFYGPFHKKVVPRLPEFPDLPQHQGDRGEDRRAVSQVRRVHHQTQEQKRQVVLWLRALSGVRLRILG